MSLELIARETFDFSQQAFDFFKLFCLLLALDDGPSESFHGWCFEKTAQGQFSLKDFPQLGNQLDRKQRIATQLEEVVVPANACDPEKLLPQDGNAFLHLVFGRHVVGSTSFIVLSTERTWLQLFEQIVCGCHLRIYQRLEVLGRNDDLREQARQN